MKSIKQKRSNILPGDVTMGDPVVFPKSKASPSGDVPIRLIIIIMNTKKKSSRKNY